MIDWTIGSNIDKILKAKRKKSFFCKDSTYIAKNILGDYLFLRRRNKFLVGKIVETESYPGSSDDASHTYRGKLTPRTKIVYQAGGIIYVYSIYGKFLCFNIVVSKKEDPQAVFIRSLEPIEGIDIMKKNRGLKDLKKLTSGPCRWTKAFGISKKFLSQDITSDKIGILYNSNKKFNIVETKRIGINYATHSKDLPLRFYIEGNIFVSKK